MNQPLSSIIQQSVVEQAVLKLRTYFHEHRLSDTEADVPWQIGQTLVEVVQGMQSDNPASWQSEFSLIWGAFVRKLLRQWGFGENYLQVGNLNDYYMSFVKEAIHV